MRLKTSSERELSFDGLRGAAALIVMISHLLQTTPLFWGIFLNIATPNVLVTLFRLPPLHTLWAGPLMVNLFFMLSGVVLSRGWKVGDGGTPALSWVKRRILRLYPPIWGAVIFTFALTVLFPRGGSWLSEWANSYDLSYSLQTFVQDIFVLRGPSQLNAPLWSLQLEIFFSLAMPVMVLCYSKLGRNLQLAAPLAAIFVGSSLLMIPNITYSAMFFLGFWLGREWRLVHLFWLRVSRKKWFQKTKFVHFPLVLVGMENNLLIWNGQSIFPTPVELALKLLCMCVLVTMAGNKSRVQSFFSKKTAVWLGKISFSLYLTHFPVILAVTSLIEPFAISLPVSFAACLAIAVLFERWVERPLHNLSKSVR